MQSSAGDETSTPREKIPKESPVPSVEETAGESTAKGSTSRGDEQALSAEVEEDEGESKKEKDQVSPAPRRERSVMFADTPREETAPLKKKEPSRLPSLREARPVTVTPQRTSSFSLLRRLTTDLFSVPFGFFQSRAEIRTWGEETLADPSVQPGGPSTARYGWGSLPNYTEKSVHFFKTKSGQEKPQFYSLAPRGGYRPAPGVPVLQFVPSPVEIPHVAPMKPPAYNWNDLKEYRMDTVPYTNAYMRPASPTGMYVGGNHLVAYPYGVPAVEENEAKPILAAVQETCTCNFWCW